MWACSQCGQENDPELIHCSNCGLKSDRPPPSPPSPGAKSRSVRTGFILAAGGVLILAVLAAIAIPSYIRARRVGSERNVSAVLRTLAAAEADFRANDRDGNRTNEFWTGDVAGLYCIGDSPIRLIERSTAAADTAPIRSAEAPYTHPIREFAEPAPRAGAWYGALEFDGSINPPVRYRQASAGTPSAGKYYNDSRFGFLGYPDQPGSSGDHVYMINENNTVYRCAAPDTIRPSDRTPPGTLTESAFTTWPNQAELMFGWERIQ